MGVCPAYILEVSRREQVKDEPIVALAQNLHRDAARLLGDENGTKVVLAPFLDPGEKGISRRDVLLQDRLGLFNHRDCWNGVRLRLRKTLLVAIENPAEDES